MINDISVQGTLTIPFWMRRKLQIKKLPIDSERKKNPHKFSNYMEVKRAGGKGSYTFSTVFYCSLMKTRTTSSIAKRYLA